MSIVKKLFLSTKEEKIIDRAMRHATRAHKGQTRKYGDKPPYIQHPKAVAEMVRNAGGDCDMIAASWLHDVVEDTNWTIAEVHEEFGADIGSLVAQLTNPSKQYPNYPRAERKRIDREHAVSISSRAKTIKVADRLHNLRGILKEAPSDFAELYLYETIQLFRALRGADENLMDALWEEIITGLGKYLRTVP